MNHETITKYLLRGTAYLGFALAFILLFFSVRAWKNYPDLLGLTRVDGFVTSTRSARYGVDFQSVRRFSDDPTGTTAVGEPASKNRDVTSSQDHSQSGEDKDQ